MIKASSFNAQTLAVFGLGRTGITAALSLAKGGADVWAWDDNEAAREAAAEQGVTVKDLKEANWSEFSALVLSPGVPDKLPTAHWTAEKANALRFRLFVILKFLPKKYRLALSISVLKLLRLPVRMGNLRQRP